MNQATAQTQTDKHAEFRQMKIDATALSKLMDPSNDGYETWAWYLTVATIMERMSMNWFGAIPQKPK